MWELEGLLASQEEMMAGLEAKIKGKIDTNNEKFEVLQGTLISQMDIHQARTQSTQEDTKAKIHIHQEKMDAWLEEMKAWQKETTACHELTEARLEKVKANPEKTKVGLEETEAAVDVFEERLKKLGPTNLEANREKTEAIKGHQKSLKKRPQWKLSEHWRTEMRTGI
jgi:hypothetical protein